MKKLLKIAGALLPMLAVAGCSPAVQNTSEPDSLMGVRLVSDSNAPAPPPTPGATPVKSVFTSVGDPGDGGAAGTMVNNFGTISQSRAEPLVHDFVLRNDSTSTLTINRIQPQCGCTTAVIQSGAGTTTSASTAGLAGVQQTETPVAPGKSVTIHVSVNPDHLVPGSARKSVLIFIKDQPDPAAQLIMSGTMLALVDFQPSTITFGEVPVHQMRSAIMMATFDRALLKEGPLPEVRLGRVAPGVRIVPIDTPSAADLATISQSPKASPGSQPAPMSDDIIKRYYRVEVTPDAPIGMGFETVTVNPGDRKEPISAFSSIAYTVVGDIQVSPASIAFGTIAEGNPSQVQQISVCGKKAANTDKLTIHADDPNLTVQYTPEADPLSLTIPNNAGKTVTLPQLGTINATLKSGIAAGTYQAKITIATSDGQKVVVPVWAYIASTNR